MTAAELARKIGTTTDNLLFNIRNGNLFFMDIRKVYNNFSDCVYDYYIRATEKEIAEAKEILHIVMSKGKYRGKNGYTSIIKQKLKDFGVYNIEDGDDRAQSYINELEGARDDADRDD